MALTAEQQAEVDLQEAMRSGDREQEAKRVKLEALRMAKEIVVENRRTQSAAEATDITAESIQAIADSLTTYVNS
ncbi:MAG: hypothetical protein CMA72_06135 [Euryarchaeota archaeon]|nr:hypothetical protein [Euryarchaeota archaeon]|tara:strand:- start:4622 stop:4846 length:225 start_codon:yes stop_codon:yes gene_type:complete